MRFIQWLIDLFFGRRSTAVASTETPDDVAERIDRFGDRCRNAGDTTGADAAREASRRAQAARTVEHAWQIERDFLNKQGHKEPKIVKPQAGRNASGTRYVNYGNGSRIGGSVGWRNNNPGYIRCDDRLSRYNAISCDGEYAIFADEQTGRVAMIEYLRHEYPGRSLHDALREQLPPDAGPNAVERVLETTRLDPNMKVDELTLDQIETVADTFPDVAGWQLGESGDAATGGDWGDEPAAIANTTATDNS